MTFTDLVTHRDVYVKGCLFRPEGPDVCERVDFGGEEYGLDEQHPYELRLDSDEDVDVGAWVFAITPPWHEEPMP